MNRIKIYFFLLFLPFIGPLFGQQPYKYCGTAEATQKLKETHPEIASDEAALEGYTQEYIQKMEAAKTDAAPTVYVIPVVFHVLHNFGGENISDAQIKSEMEILNRDYNKLNADTAAAVAGFPKIIGNVRFQFRLAQIDPNGNCTNGIDRIQTLLTYNATDNSKLNQWPRNKYLNVWTAASLDNGAAGYAYTPGSVANNPSIDGILILSSYIGNIGSGQAVTSRALTHEIGHFFNLQHPWGPTNSPGVSCGDDGVSDTPITKGYSSCPASSTAAEICTSGVVENYQNFMDYSYCSCMFTAGQVTRMTAAITSTTCQRNNLWAAANLTATGVSLDTTQNNLCTAAFANSSSVVCAGSTVTFTDNSWNGPRTSWNWNFEGGTPATASTANPVITYNTPGTYSVSFTVSNGTQTTSTTKTNVVTVMPDTAVYKNAFFESFENNFTLPNANWTTASKWASGTNWSVNNGAAFDGSSCVSIDNSGNDSGSVYQLVGPTVNMSTIANPKLYFRIAYAAPSGVTVTDAFRVWASTNCGATWSGHGTYTGASLASTTAQTPPWTPTSTSQWKTDSVNLSGIASATDVRFMFEFTNGAPAGKGAMIYLDAINIGSNKLGVSTGISAINGAENRLTLMPNPAQNNSVLSLTLKETSLVTLNVMDVLGNVVLSPISNQVIAQGQQQVIINRNGLAAGIYFIRTKINDRVYTQKLIFN